MQGLSDEKKRRLLAYASMLQNILKHKAQVIKMSIYEFDAEKQRKFDREEGIEEGIEKGSNSRLIIQIQKKIKKEKNLNVITDELESDEVEIRPLYDAVLKYGVDADPKDILEKMNAEAEAEKEG